MQPSGVTATLRAATRASAGARFRIGWMVATFSVGQAVVCGLAVMPVVLVWQWLIDATSPGVARLVILSLVALPSYGVFAICLMAVSAFTLRVTGWQTPRDCQMRIADFEWP